MEALAPRLMAMVIMATDLGIDFTPSRSGGPGARSFDLLIGYAAWAAFRVAVVGFFVSLAVATFGRMQTHPGAEQLGKRGIITALVIAIGIRAAGALFEFATAIGSAA